MSEECKTIHEIIRELEDNDLNGQTTSSQYVTQNMREDINKTEAYLNSKHISGDTDYLGREKPFFNIVNAAVNVWYRATDLDCKNIIIRPTSAKTVIPAFLATLKLQEWMRKVNFGKFLNKWGLTLSQHGSAIPKFIEKDGELSCQVMDWNNMLVDAIDFDGNVKVEKLWFTPAQLKKQKGYDKKMVKELLENQTVRTILNGQAKDTKAGYIPVYEVHGELPLSFLTGNDKDDDTYVQQMHVISFQSKKDGTGKKDYDDYTLYSGREARDPYMITHLIEKDGQTYPGGAVKNLFDAQWMVNNSQKQIKDQLDLASKIIFQTSDGNFVGQNMLTDVENGDILNHALNQPLTRLAGSPDIAAMQSFQASWQNVANQINGIAESMIMQAKSGTAWRQTQAELQEAHSLFELMTENKGLAVVDMLRNYVIPFFHKQLNNSDEIATVLEDYQIKQIDSWYIPNEVIRRVNQKKKETILSGKIYDPAQEAADMALAEAELRAGLTGNQRFIKPSDIKKTTWKEILSEVNFDNLEIDITGEVRDVQGALATLSTVFQTIAGLQGQPMSEDMKLVFGEILKLSSTISPLQLNQSKAQPVPAMAGVGGAAVPQPA